MSLSPNYPDAKKVVDLLHVHHLKFVGEEGLDLIDFDEMLVEYECIMAVFTLSL